jgi:hypothetical protein
MKVDVLGLASNIKDAIRGPRRDELCFMVDQMAEHIVKIDAIVDALPKTTDGVPFVVGTTVDVVSGHLSTRYRRSNATSSHSPANTSATTSPNRTNPPPRALRERNTPWPPSIRTTSPNAKAPANARRSSAKRSGF